jgi:hypothetical protein
MNAEYGSNELLSSGVDSGLYTPVVITVTYIFCSQKTKGKGRFHTALLIVSIVGTCIVLRFFNSCVLDYPNN